MSVPVALDDLARQIDRFGAAAFLLTVSDDGRPHPASVRVTRAADGTLHAPAGRRTSANATAQRGVTLLWAGPDDGFALLVDGTAVLSEEGLVVTPTSAILHKLAS